MLVEGDLLQGSLLKNAIPPCPEVVRVLSQEVDSEDADFGKMEQAILGDVAVAGAVLRTVNSAYYGFSRPIQTIRHALSIMGVRSVARVVACVALRLAFPSVSLQRFWDCSGKVAAISSKLVRERRWEGLTPDDAYTYGLFRDSGIAVLLLNQPRYLEVLHCANTSTEKSFHEVERGTIPVPHTTVGAALSDTWWLPMTTSMAILNHHDVEALKSIKDERHVQVARLIAVAQLAELLYQRATGLCQTAEWLKLGESCMERLEINETDLQSFIDKTPAFIASIQ